MKELLKLESHGKNCQLPQIVAILSSCLAAISDSMLYAWTSPAIPELVADKSLNISLEEASYLTMINPISMALTAPLFSIAIDRIGRKAGVILLAVPQIICWIMTAYVKSIWLFYLVRFIEGISDAALFATIPIYIGEISEPKVRGTWGNSLAISIYVGIFVINVLGAFFDISTAALISSSLPIVHILVFFWMPESPYYLLMKKREEDARKSLQLLRWRDDVDEELAQLKSDVQRQISESGTFKDLFTIDSNRRALFLCIGLRVAMHFSGLVAFELYTEYLFQQSGGNLTAKESAIIFTGILTLCAGGSAFIVEKFGRRPLMIFSCLGCGIVLTIEAGYFAVVQFTDVDVTDFQWLPLVGMIAYILVCSAGLGIIPTLVLGEIFSASIKSKATIVANIALAGCTLIVPKVFQSMTEHFGIFGPFCFFAVCCYLSVAFSYFYVIETKGKTLEEIQQELKQL